MTLDKGKRTSRRIKSMDCTDFEFHLPSMHFCGPGTDFNTRLESDGLTPKKNSQPVNCIDAAALKHDIYYSNHRDAHSRIAGDKQMIDEVMSIENPTCREAFEQVIVVAALSVKQFFTICFFKIVDTLTERL